MAFEPELPFDPIPHQPMDEAHTWKPKGEEFDEADFCALVDALGLHQDQVDFFLHDHEVNGVAGHKLVAKPKE